MSDDQLPLPFAEAPGAGPSVFTIPHRRRVWVNRTLRMDQVDWVGFDMDYTLAIYRQTEIDRLSIEATVSKLLARGYPAELANVEFRYDFPVRGLLIDKRFGHVLKMDRYKFVGRAFHGYRELSWEERRALYHARKIRPVPPRYHWIDTLYALPEAALYAGAVDLLDRQGKTVDYEKLFEDIRRCIDEAHQDGAIVDVIERNLPQFVERDPELAPTLHKLRSAGKKLFLLTNSRWGYTDSMMKFLIEGVMQEYPSWRNYFDVIVTASRKPAFFQERKPFVEIVDGTTTGNASSLERGKIYAGGNLRDFERWIGTGADAILYIGDHIYGDMLRSKKESAWRTAMIVQEMEAESDALERTHDQLAQVDSLARKRDRLEDELRFRQARLKHVVRALGERSSGAKRTTGAGASAGAARGGGEPVGAGTLDLLVSDVDGLNAPASESEMSDAHAHVHERSRPPTFAAIATPETPEEIQRLEVERLREKRSIERIRAALRQLDEEARSLAREADRAFHPFWGSIFKQGVELSSFGDQVENYACVYTSRVSNLLAYSPLHYFRSPRDFMPHELP